jgi:YbbR domain-containing protein
MKKKIIPISLIILFSIVLWGSVSLSGEFIATINVPIELVDLPNNYTTGYISNKDVYMRVKSKGWEIAKIFLGTENKFDVSVHRKMGRRKIDLKDEIQNNGWLTSSVQVLEIVPSQVECDVDKIVSKNVAVTYNLDVKYKEGYGLASDIILSPSVVKIYGPYSILQNIDTVETEYMELVDVNEPIDTEIKLKEIEGISYSSTACNLQMDVQKIVDRSFEDIVVDIRNVPTSKELILYPSKISVVIKGGINNLGRLTNDSIKAYVDFWTVMRNEGEPIEPTIEYPSYSSLVDIKPRKLEYVIKQY